MARFLIGVASLSIVATSAMAQQPGSPAAAVAPVQSAKPKKVCRTFQITGRRIAQTQCYTAEQWAELDRTREDAAGRLIRDVNGAAATAHLPAGSVNTSSLFGLGNPQ